MKTCASVARLKPLLAAHFCRRTYEAVSSILADTERRAGPFATADATYLRCMCAADAAVTQVHRPWILYISKWVDYSNKYGFGFQLSDNSVGIMFNDDTRMVLTADNASVHTAALLSPRRGGAGIKRCRDPPVRPSVCPPRLGQLISKFHYTDTDTGPTRTGPDTDKVRARCRV